MKGLIIKDLLILKKYSKTILIIFVAYALMSIIIKESDFLSGFIILIFTMMTITSFSYDDLAKWDRFALSLPISRKTLILSKYILSLILIFTGTLVSLLMKFLITMSNKTSFTTGELMASAAIMGIGLISISVILPLLLKFGVEKSRIIIVGVFFIPYILAAIFSKMNIPMPSYETIMLLLKLSPILIILFFIASFFISCNIYKNKEV